MLTCKEKIKTKQVWSALKVKFKRNDEDDKGEGKLNTNSLYLKMKKVKKSEKTNSLSYLYVVGRWRDSRMTKLLAVSGHPHQWWFSFPVNRS